MNKSVAVIGAGAVGTNVAIFLSKIGIKVNLFDTNEDILLGSPMASFINHGDGFEYYKHGHQITGKHCIDGSMVKGLIYPLSNFRTQIVNEQNPIRFLVSSAAVKHKLTPFTDFYRNAEFMKQHFSNQFHSVKKIRKWSVEDAGKAFLRTPKHFYRKLTPSDYKDINGIVGGCAGSSFGINMSHYFAYLKAAMRFTGVELNGAVNVECIEKKGLQYIIHYNGKTSIVDHVVVTAGHHIPFFTKNAKNFHIAAKSSGTYYLNSMTFVELPPTTDQEKLTELQHINFTLQGEYGSMFACILMPTANQSGIAAIYFPSSDGSQLHDNIYNKSHSIQSSPDWDYFIQMGLPNSDSNVKNTFDQACYFYPFLKGYAKVRNTICRTVFNLSVSGSLKGTDRRVRQIGGSPIMASEDQKVTMWAAPKWTNAELVALIVTDNVLTSLGLKEFPKTSSGGFGPTSLDVGRLSQQFNFLDLKMNLDDAYEYAKIQGIPERIVDTNLSPINHKTNGFTTTK